MCQESLFLITMFTLKKIAYITITMYNNNYNNGVCVKNVTIMWQVFSGNENKYIGRKMMELLLHIYKFDLIRERDNHFLFQDSNNLSPTRKCFTISF